ncbi:hypothetical protein Rleg10DRAFT_5638 [Rhizobium leguminosarum bv. trifolii WSM2012]|nr:hypothetical protein Rleg10DRAFT_4348 [Rhizobium leguminosarum bv. trifolii WSM2012]EJC76946.1 hypothetical protein Rleg10DRAFT_5638 [Rhizobium leguminosarum bv. trifolii WSM2012]
MPPHASRLGSFFIDGTPSTPTPTLPQLGVSSTFVEGQAVSSNYRGKARPITTTFSFDEFAHVALIHNHQSEIFEEFIRGRSPSTHKAIKKRLRSIFDFVSWIKDKFGVNASHRDDMTLNTNTLILMYMKQTGGSYEKINFFRRFLRGIGVEPSEIPLNTNFSCDPAPRDILSSDLLRRMYLHFKGEAQIVMRRLDEYEDLRHEGRDPRRDHGGRTGDWQKPANRLYILINVIGIEIKPVNSNRELGLRTAVAGLENFPGAETLREDGRCRRRKGVTGHLAWIYPGERDLLPFIVLLLIKTRFNLSVILGLTIGEYQFRPVSLEFEGSEKVMQFAALKQRTKNEPNSEPNWVHCLCLVRPYAHPFKIVQFLELLTKPLRVEAARKLAELKSKTRLLPDEKSYLIKLEAIKDDLLLYYAAGKISSFGAYANSGERPSSIVRALKNLGFPSALSDIRNTLMAFGTGLSGSTQSVISLLGDHRNGRTAKNYLNRKQVYAAYDDLFVDVFEKSLVLIEVGQFSRANLKLILSSQGFGSDEVRSLLTKNMLTKWGNRCSSPTAPPPGFDEGTSSGAFCARQNCIDGCPNARWFPDADDVLKQREEEMETKLSRLGLAVTIQSVIHDRLRRCRKLIEAIRISRSGDE